MRFFLKKLRSSRDGASGVEYAVLVGLVVLTILPVWQVIGGSLSEMFYGRVLDVFTAASSGV